MSDQPVVVFVDDDPKLLDGIRRSQHRWGGTWTAEYFSGAQGAINYLTNHQAAVVVTDLAMPGLDGIELIQRINRTHPEIACMMLSGTADMSDAVSLINAANIFRFFSKPTESSLLFGAIDEAIEQWRQSQSNPDEALDIGLAALDRVAIGMVVVNQDGCLQHGNQSAMAEIHQKSALFLDREGHVKAYVGDQTPNLQAAFEKVLSSDTDDTISLVLHRAKGERPLVASISRLSPTLALMMLLNPDQYRAPEIDTLRVAYDLTPSEAKLAQILARGASLEQSAEQVGLTIESARTYLKRIFRKTETARQPELVRLLALTSR